MKEFNVLSLCEAVDELRRHLEASAAAEEKRKRKRDAAVAIGLIGQGPAIAKAAAGVLPKRPARRLRRTVDVSAFQTIGPRGALRDPVEIAPGDDLYIARPESPGAGTVSRDPLGIPYAVALGRVAAGVTKAISVVVHEKLWLTDGKPCEICEENSIAGWIPIDRAFPSGDWEPKAHPNCKCSLEVRRVD